MNPDLLAVRPHASRTISDAIRDDPDVVDLTVGISDFGPPEVMRAALAVAVAAPSALDRYEHAQGNAALRQAVCRRYGERYDLAYEPDQILVTQGASDALWLAVFTFTAPGDGVLLSDPGYTLYGAVVEALGRRAIRLTTSPADGFRMTPGAVAAALASPGPSARPASLMILNSPENPTGAVYERERLTAVVQVALDHGLVVVHDEVFDDFCWAHDHVPAARVTRPGAAVVMVNSMSKRYGMTGWRLGWMAGPADLVAAATKAHTFAMLASPSIVQAAVVPALSDSGVAAEVAAHRATLRDRMARVAATLADLPGFDLGTHRPGGGFYLFPQVADVDAPGAGHTTHGEAVADLLLRQCRVAVVPGIAYGPAGHDHIRLSVAGPDPELDQALDRLRRTFGTRSAQPHALADPDPPT